MSVFLVVTLFFWVCDTVASLLHKGLGNVRTIFMKLVLDYIE